RNLPRRTGGKPRPGRRRARAPFASSRFIVVHKLTRQLRTGEGEPELLGAPGMTIRESRGKTSDPRKPPVLEKAETQKFNGYDRPHADLREFIAPPQPPDEVVRIGGADWKLEMGTLAEIVNHARAEPPAILFE